MNVMTINCKDFLTNKLKMLLLLCYQQVMHEERKNLIMLK